MSGDARWSRAATWAALIGAVLAIYLPDVGHGFVQDDFAWILHARSESVMDALERAFTTSLGFYRPLVTLSFAVDEWLFGLQPFGYGLTNLLFALACMLAIERLGRRLGLAPHYALLAAAIWILNFHGINMGVLWLSGRSSLLSTLFGVLAASMLEARRPIASAGLVFLALLSKEDAVLLPFILASWRLVDARSGGSEDPPLPARAKVASIRQALQASWLPLAVLAVYAVLRNQSGAFTPSNAPDFYRFTADPTQVTRNFIEYLQRSVLTGAVVAIGLLVVTRARPRLEHPQVTVTKALLWWLGGFALTMWLPVRSSLYAVFPSVGVAIGVGVLAESLVPMLPRARRRMLLIVGLLLPFLFLPVYRSRNVRWVSLADLTAATLAYVHPRVSALPDRTMIALIDDQAVRANFINAFSSLTPEASQLFLTRGIELAVDPPLDGSRPRVEIPLADVVYTR